MLFRSNSPHAKLIVDKAAKRAIIGDISYDFHEKNGLAQVSSSAALGGFGPLIYQIIMYLHPGLWLASDISLTPPSKVIWNKMYEYSNSGMYERKFLGDFSKVDVTRRAKIAYKDLSSYIHDIQFLRKPLTEEYFLNWLRENHLEPREFGYLWAYKKLENDPKIEELFKGGERFVEQAEDKFDIPKEDLINIIEDSGARMFQNLYDK